MWFFFFFFTLLEGLKLLICQAELLAFVLQREGLPAELCVLQGLGLGVLPQFHHFGHENLSETLLTLLR